MVQLQVIGNVGKDAVVKTVGSNTVINFSVAYTTGYGDNKQTNWVDCAKWGEKTGIAQYLTKGTKVYVSGEPVLKSYQKQDGTTGTSLVLTVSNIELVSNKSEANAQAAPATDDFDTQLPF